MSAVLHVISGLASGGAEAVLFDLATHDQKNTHIIISLSGMDVYGEKFKVAGIPVYSLNMKRGRISLQGLFSLYRIILKRKPDVVQTWMYHSDLVGGMVAFFAGVRQIVWGIHNGISIPALPSHSTRITVWLCARLSSSLPQLIVACSKSTAQMHAELKYEEEKLVVIRNGYNLSRFKPDSEQRKRLREEWDVGEDDFLFGMVARWDPVKDHANLLKACSEMVAKQDKSWFCILVGFDVVDSNSSLMDLIEIFDLQRNMILLGSRQDVPAIMNALDLHVLSSRAEAFPNVVSEAMACSTPCVVTNVGDAAEIVADCGWIVPTQNSKRMTCSIREAMSMKKNDAAAWSTLKQRNRDRVVNNFSLEQMIKSYDAVWNNFDNDMI